MIRLFVLSLLLLVGCNASFSPKSGQIIRINIGEDPQSIDPRKARGLPSETLVHMFFEGLMRSSKTGELEMALAERVEVSSDGLQYRFYLRNSFWSNGEPVTAFDFAESWRAILDPGFPTDVASHLYGIKNGQKAKLGEVSVSQVGISTPDSQTLIVELERPIPYFLQLVSMSPFFPIPHKYAIRNPNWAFDPKTYICNGPFKLQAWGRFDRIVAEKNPKYWQAKDVVLSRIDVFMIGDNAEIQMFERGDLDWAGSPLSTIPVAALRDLRFKEELHISPFSGTYFCRVNTAEILQDKKNPLHSPIFRKALALALDRKAIAEHVLQGGQIPANSLVPPQMGLSDKGYFQDNPVQARSALVDALLKLDMTLDKLEPIRLSFPNADRNMVVAQAVQKQWETVLGVRVELEALATKSYFQRVSRKEFQMAIGSWTADFNDPVNFLEVFKYKDKSANNTNWESSRYVDLLNRSDQCSDSKERMAFLREAESVLMDQMPIIPIVHYSLNYLKRGDLRDVVLSSLGKIDFRWAHLEEN